HPEERGGLLALVVVGVTPVGAQPGVDGQPLERRPPLVLSVEAEAVAGLVDDEGIVVLAEKAVGTGVLRVAEPGLERHARAIAVDALARPLPVPGVPQDLGLQA